MTIIDTAEIPNVTAIPTNIESVAYAGETPWHGLGNPIRKGATVDEMRAAAQLGWDPVLVEQWYVNPTAGDLKSAIEAIVQDLANKKIGRSNAQSRLEELLNKSTQKLIVRNDNNTVLSIAGVGTEVMSNGWVFEFFRTYCELGGLTMETAGSLNGGRYVWCLAKVNESFKLPGNDKVDEYVLLYNPNIYGKGARAKLTLIRVVCKNTLTMALRGEQSKDVKIWHSKPFDEARRQEVQTDLAAINAQFKLIHEAADALVEFKLDAPDAKLLTYQIMERTDETPEMLETVEGWDEHATKNAKRVYELYTGKGMGADKESAKGTGWGLLNATTQFVDWERGNTQESRLQVSWFSYGETLKQTAMERLLLEAGQSQLARAIVKERVKERVEVR